MLEQDKLNHQDELNSQLLSAATRGDSIEVKKLIKNGADVNVMKYKHSPYFLDCKTMQYRSIEYFHETPLYNAFNHPCLEEKHIETAKILIENNANMNASCKSVTPLFQAVQKGDPDLVKWMATNGADVNLYSRLNGTSMSPLSAALLVYDYDMAQVLIELNADVNAADEVGNTPLHYVVKSDFSGEIVQSLIDRGADVNVKNKQNKTPLQVALKYWNKEAAEILENAAHSVITKERAIRCILPLMQNQVAQHIAAQQSQHDDPIALDEKIKKLALHQR